MMHRKSYGFFAQNLFIKLWSKQFSYWKKINRETLASIAMIQLAKKQNKKTPVKHTQEEEQNSTRVSTGTQN